jgi:hypothetical protein
MEQFHKLDDTIKTGAKTFMEVGQALVTMHAGQLYRATFPTFKEYAASRGISRSHDYRLMEAVQTTMQLENEAETKNRIPRVGQIQETQNQADTKPVPGNENEKLSLRAIDALGKYPREKQTEIRELARANGDISSRGIESAAAAVLHTAPPAKKTARLTAPSSEPDPSEFDEPAVVETTHVPTYPAPEPTPPPTFADTKPYTPAQFQKDVYAIEARINAACTIPAEHQKYGVIANALANRQMNFKAGPRLPYNPYSSK